MKEVKAKDPNNIDLEEFNKIMKSLGEDEVFTSIKKKSEPIEVNLYELKRDDAPDSLSHDYTAIFNRDTGELLNLINIVEKGFMDYFDNYIVMDYWAKVNQNRPKFFKG